MVTSKVQESYVKDGMIQENKEVQHIINQKRWNVVVSHRWRWCEQHINILEGEAVLLGLRYLLENKNFHHTVVPWLIDSSALIGALVKGRSSSKRLNKICQKVALLSILSDVKVAWIWVPSSWNPADAASRSFSL